MAEKKNGGNGLLSVEGQTRVCQLDRYLLYCIAITSNQYINGRSTNNKIINKNSGGSRSRSNNTVLLLRDTNYNVLK